MVSAGVCEPKATLHHDVGLWDPDTLYSLLLLQNTWTLSLFQNSRFTPNFTLTDIPRDKLPTVPKIKIIFSFG